MMMIFIARYCENHLVMKLAIILANKACWRMLFSRCYRPNNEPVTPAKPGLARPFWLYALAALAIQTQRRTFGAMPRTTPKFGVFVLRSLARFFASTKTRASIDTTGVALVNLAIGEHNFAWGQNQFQGSSGQPNVRLLHSKTAAQSRYYASCWLMLLAYV